MKTARGGISPTAFFGVSLPLSPVRSKGPVRRGKNLLDPPTSSYENEAAGLPRFFELLSRARDVVGGEHGDA